MDNASDLLDELRSTLDRAAELVAELPRAAPAAPSSDVSKDEADRLRRDLDAAAEDTRELSNQLVESEQQRGRLMSLYVAIYQLHSTLDPEDVQATIAEIAIDLLGAQGFALILSQGEGEDGEIALSQGVDEGFETTFGGNRYRGGDPMVDATLEDGVLRLSPFEGSNAVAAVPLTVQGATVGSLVLLRLLDHKPDLEPGDREILDLLAAHAASALFAARVYSATDRKLRTLESLVKLVRG